MTVTHFLLIVLGLLAWDIVKHLYRGAQLWRLHRQAQQWGRFQAWRQARIAGARVTYPAGYWKHDWRAQGAPYLGLDVPVFTERSKA